MILTIIDYIVAALRGAFPDVTDVYTEQVKQGLTTPCFIINCVSPKSQLFIATKYKRNNLFSVHYLPESDINGKMECNAVCENLFQTLEIIGVEGDFVRGTGMSAEHVGGALVFTVNYNLFVLKEPDDDPMETLEIEKIEAR